MKKSPLLSVLILAFCISTPLISQVKLSEANNGLSSFSRLIGGKWYLGDSYQVFEWGLGQHSVKSSSYFIVDGVPQLISEGMWYRHPGKGEIEGIFSAINMPAVLFMYTTKFEQNKMLNELTTYTAEGKAETFSEVWEFVGKDSYKWTLYSNTAKVRQKIMEGIYKRKTDDQ